MLRKTIEYEESCDSFENLSSCVRVELPYLGILSKGQDLSCGRQIRLKRPLELRAHDHITI